MISYNRTHLNQKWTLMKYFNDFDMLTLYANALRTNTSLTDSSIEDLMLKMIDEGIYKPRENLSIDTGKFKTIQVAWYMFGFYEKGPRSSKRFVFSPLGNLLLDNLGNKDAVSKIFATMLVGNPFRNPFSRMSAEFNIFPFRLIFQLLLDERLENKLFNDEIFYLLMFVKSCVKDDLELLIRDILKLRNLSTGEKYKTFKRNENVLANAIHEWRYTSKLLEGSGILKIHEGINVGSLIQGNNTGSRAYRTDCVALTPEIKTFIKILLKQFPFYEKPYEEEELETQFSDDYWISFYNFYPKILIDELEISTQDKNQDILDIISGITNYSLNQHYGDHDRFEEALTDSFNLFIDVDAKRLGGSGQTDVECIYTSATRVKTFAIEAKSTGTKITEVNTARLLLHRENIKAEYTLLVTPKFTPGAISDIRGNDIVLLKSSILSNYLYQSIKHKGRKLTYEFLDNMITKNLGLDISDQLKNHIFDEFGVAFNT